MKFRTLLLGLSALFIAFNAAFFSVTGLAKLFAGASLSVILMASSLELAKLIVAGYLYNYWEKINKGFRIYLLGATFVLVLITSLGIYGFLTAAFQNTFKTYSVTSKEKSFLQQKEKFWESDVVRYDKELERISENISTLSSAKSQQIQYKDSDGTIRNSVSTTELKAAQSRITTEETNRKEVQSKRQIAADSLQSIQLQILEIDTNVEVGSELGPLEYLSGLLGKPMDVIINWFILIIIFVFDPLAIALVVAFNNALKVDKGEDDKKKVVQKRELYGEVEEHPKDEKNESFGSSSDISDESTINENIIELNDKEKQRELIKEIIQADEKDGLYDDGLYDEELANLKPDFSRRGVDIDGDGTIDGYDTNGDGLIDEPAPASSRRAQWAINEKPYYARPGFNWGNKSKWINDQNAVNYWFKNIRNNSGYPTDFESKTY